MKIEKKEVLIMPIENSEFYIEAFIDDEGWTGFWLGRKGYGKKVAVYCVDEARNMDELRVSLEEHSRNLLDPSFMNLRSVCKSLLDENESMDEGTFDIREEIDHMPYDHSFWVDGDEELCHATGYRVNGWNEFIDHNGDLHYGG